MKWGRHRLGELLEVQNGYAFDSKSFSATEGMPLIRIRDLKGGASTETRYAGEFDESYIVRAGDLLIGMDGEFGCYQWSGEPALLNQRVCRLRNFREKLLPRFLYYGVNSHLKAIEEVTGFTTVKHLSSKQIVGIEFAVPPLPEQQRIVGILDEAFAGIATAKANAEKNLRNSRELFNSQLTTVFTKNGAGWTEKRLGEICEIARGGSPRPIKSFITTDPNGINWVKIGDATASDKYIFETEERIRPEGARRSRAVKSGDFILSNSMSFGRPYIMRTSGCIHDGWLLLRDVEEVFDQDYLYHFLGSPAAYAQFDALAAGSTVRNLNIDSVRSVCVHYPCLSEQAMIADRLNRLWDEVKQGDAVYQRKLGALNALKASILHCAFTGMLTMKAHSPLVTA